MHQHFNTSVVLGCACLVLLASQAASGAAAPANDQFANRTTLAGTNLTATGSNVGGTKETDEPLHAGDTGGKSVWWSWTAPTNGEVVINTDGSNFDTLLAVYTGSAVSALSVVGSDDDHGAPGQVTSRLKFEAAQGIPYQIAVDGYNDGTGAASGDIILKLAFIPEPILRPPNDNFSNRVVLAGSAVVTNGSNVGATQEAGEPHHAGKLGDTSVWWSWTAPAAAKVRITTEGSSFDTLLAVYSGSSLSNLDEIARNDDADAASGVLTSVVSFDTIAGQVYQIAVDGFDGASGQISLRIDNATTTLSAAFRASDGTFQFILNGLASGTYQIDATADFAGWTTVTTLINTNGTQLVVDRTATNLDQRFYRARLKL
jgi:hypothetical protein